MEEKGLVEVFTGEGKGKTSAALGIVLRSLGHGKRVCFISFMKGKYPYGEVAALATLPNVTLSQFGHLDFVDPRDVKPEEKEEAGRALSAARKAIMGGEYDLVVLDEVNIAAAWGLIDIADVVRLVEDKPPRLDLILTGRHASNRLVELADMVTEMVMVKHPYQKGQLGKRGIDY